MPITAIIWHWLVATSVIWLPVALVMTLVKLYFYYIQARFLSKLEYTLLEIKLPQEIFKSPAAMEIALLNSLYQTWDGDNLLIGQWLVGQVRGWASLELVSIGGEVHFFIWVQKFFKNLVEAQIYAQYPGVEIFTVDDYTNKVPYGVPGSDWKLWGAEFALTKPDAYPIKTYVDYGLGIDKPDKEEQFKIDPITSTLEYLGSLNKNEQLWIQIMVMATKKRFRKPGTLFAKEDWKDNSKALLNKLMKRDKKKEGADFGSLVLSPGERETVEAVERGLGKQGFDCGIRAIYLAKGEAFRPINIVGTLGIFKQYGSPKLNGFKPGKHKTSITYPWQDPTGKRLALIKLGFFDAYRRRSYFYPPYQRTPFVLNTEELATIYHFPGKVAETPSLGKIGSKRAEPPPDLPVA
jgi:hypothetical protein